MYGSRRELILIQHKQRVALGRFFSRLRYSSVSSSLNLVGRQRVRTAPRQGLAVTIIIKSCLCRKGLIADSLLHLALSTKKNLDLSSWFSSKAGAYFQVRKLETVSF